MRWFNSIPTWAKALTIVAAVLAGGVVIYVAYRVVKNVAPVTL